VQLQADLREEVEGNLDHLREDVHIMDERMVWLTSWNAAVQNARDRRVPLTLSMPGDSVGPIEGHAYSRPSIAVWSVAEHDTTVGLLPRDEAQAFGRIASLRDSYLTAYDSRIAAYRERKAFEARFSDAVQPTVPLFARMSPDQLDAYSAMLMREFEGIRDEERYLLYLFGAYSAVLAGRYSEQDIINGVYSKDGYIWSGPGKARPELSVGP
jgi:hypothetical protein